MEQLLREALSARASQISAHDLRPAAPPSRRVRRLRPVYVAAVPLFGLAAALAFSVLGFKGDSVANRNDAPPAATLTATPSPTFTPSASPSAPTPSTSTSTSPSPSATTEPADDGEDDGSTVPPAAGTQSGTPTTATSTTGASTPYTFHGVKVQLPQGWKAVPRAEGSSNVCLMSPGAPAGVGTDCAPYGVLLTAYDSAETVADATWPTSEDLDMDGGWAHQPYCDFWGNPHTINPGEEQAYKLAGKPAHGVATVGGRIAFKTQWTVSCNAKETYSVQAWGFHREQVFLIASGLKSDYQNDLQSIVQSMDLSKHPDPVSRPHERDLKVTFGGQVADGFRVTTDGTATTFSVTWTNVSQTNYAAVQPVVAAEPDKLAANVGTLERQDGTVWTKLPLSRPATGSEWAGTGASATFSLAPGKSRTVNYRMTLAPENEGDRFMPVKGYAFASEAAASQATPASVGDTRVSFQVVKK